MRHRSHKQRRAQASRPGFTLIESAMVTAIIGFGVVGMVELLAAGTNSNSEGAELTTAVNLANNVREISMGMAFRDPQLPNTWATKEGTGNANSDAPLYDDVLDLDNATFSPPLDVRRQPITGYAGWAQNVVVESVDPNQIAAVRPDTVTLPTARVTVTVTRNGQFVHSASWLVVAPNSN
jgi:type II secretory pathway pseudopilin PulG